VEGAPLPELKYAVVRPLAAMGISYLGARIGVPALSKMKFLALSTRGP
jgi:hypothetical protein